MTKPDFAEAQTLLAELDAIGITVTLDGRALRLDGDTSTMPPSAYARFWRLGDQLMSLLDGESEPARPRGARAYLCEIDGCRWHAIVPSGWSGAARLLGLRLGASDVRPRNPSRDRIRPILWQGGSDGGEAA